MTTKASTSATADLDTTKPATIVVPLDGSDFAERALLPAGALAARTGAQVVVMTSSHGGVLVEPESYLAEAAARAGIPGAKLSVSDRDAVGVLESLVTGVERPLICMTTHGRSGLGQAILGSIAEEVTRGVNVPLLLVGPAADLDVASRFDTAVVCTDGSDVAKAIEPVISEWIRAVHLRAWVVQVLDPDTRRALDEAGETLVEEGQVFSMAQALMHRDGTGINWDVLHGERAAAAIVEYASRLPASVIAMATHGRTGLARLALGSVAASVVHDAKCPVLLVRPGTLHEE